MRIQKEFNHEIEINKSRFICYINRVDSEIEAREFITKIKKLHPKANHHCSAILIDSNVQRSSDDNEPSGTAGVPMLEALRKNNMEKIVAVTVRYFGGIKLGAGGLIRAYSKSVSETLALVTKFDIQILHIYNLVVDYSTANKLEKFLSSITVIDKQYKENVNITFAIKDNNILKNLDEILLGKYKPNYIKDSEIEILVF